LSEAIFFNSVKGKNLQKNLTKISKWGKLKNPELRNSADLDDI